MYCSFLRSDVCIWISSACLFCPVLQQHYGGSLSTSGCLVHYALQASTRASLVLEWVCTGSCFRLSPLFFPLTHTFSTNWACVSTVLETVFEDCCLLTNAVQCLENLGRQLSADSFLYVHAVTYVCLLLRHLDSEALRSWSAWVFSGLNLVDTNCSACDYVYWIWNCSHSPINFAVPSSGQKWRL